MSRGFASNLMYSTKKESIVSLVFSVISSFFLFLTQGKKVDMLCHHLPICFIQRASRFLTIHNGVKSILKQLEEFSKYSNIRNRTKSEEISWVNNSIFNKERRRNLKIVWHFTNSSIVFRFSDFLIFLSLKVYNLFFWTHKNRTSEISSSQNVTIYKSVKIRRGKSS